MLTIPFKELQHKQLFVTESDLQVNGDLTGFNLKIKDIKNTFRYFNNTEQYPISPDEQVVPIASDLYEEGL